ncbi:quinolinate synthase NadA [Halanaerobium hydrogeniformans]|uniref:Quinolinate synthase n=1 Tax=Halanaerobium hydrogeniformans TaxID=656519 RepID=E4RPF3_HALHG|nr:quinolinate synthase NadA [Halanaerobium hydrogeniformans]ADQ13838.1 quinolinate synthetase complex, A subunit [Halanaerobium hydrogeniformans]
MNNSREKIARYKKKQDAEVLAHYYQPEEIQDIADFVGYSEQLNQRAFKSNAQTLVLCGVNFMAQNAKIMAPKKRVIIPEIMADCPMVKKANLECLNEMREKHPKAAVVSFINSSAEVKAESDICCTANNALKIIKSLPQSEIILVPNKNLGEYISQKTKKTIYSCAHPCPIHDGVGINDLKRIKKQYADAQILVNLDCKEEVREKADFVGDPEEILKYAKSSKAKKMIIGAERGLLYKLNRENPRKRFYLLSPHLICQSMKINNLYKTSQALENLEIEVKIDEYTRLKAEHAIKKMKYYEKHHYLTKY